MKTPLLRWILAATTVASLFLGAAHAQVDTSKSTVTATSKQMNVPVDGTFKKFAAQLSFDPAKPAAGSAKLSIDTASYDLGDESYNAQVRGKEWFDAAQYPNATFVSSAIAPAGGNQFKVTVPVTVAQQGSTQSFDGALPIKRSQFDIGTGEWKDTSVVADEVVIKFHIVAAKK
jgi:polyisoprenoid-binding protein YceI